MSFANFNDGLFNLSQSMQSLSGSVTNGITSVSGALDGVELPAIKTESTFEFTPMTYIGLGGLVLMVFMIMRK